MHLIKDYDISFSKIYFKFRFLNHPFLSVSVLIGSEILSIQLLASNGTQHENVLRKSNFSITKAILIHKM